MIRVLAVVGVIAGTVVLTPTDQIVSAIRTSFVEWFGIDCLTRNSTEAFIATICRDQLIPESQRSEMQTGASDPISFAGLEAGETIEMWFHSQGCYHDNRYRLVFRALEGGGLRLTIQPMDLQGTAMPTREIGLDTQAVARLDRILHYYRNEDVEGVCTSVTRLTITAFDRWGWWQSTERYTDATCGFSGTYARDDLWFWGNLLAGR